MTVWTQFILTEIKNRNVREHQHVDGCTIHELLQDISSLASYDVYCNPRMASDANVTQGLQKNMLLSAPLQYHCADGTAKPMTLTQAMASEKRWSGDVSIVNQCPLAADFLCNSNNSNHMKCNQLVAPAAMAAAISVASSVRKKAMKRASDIFFSRVTSPATKKSSW